MKGTLSLDLICVKPNCNNCSVFEFSDSAHVTCTNCGSDVGPYGMLEVYLEDISRACPVSVSRKINLRPVD
jgi:hypothetical protein